MDETCIDENLVDDLLQAIERNKIDIVRRMLETTPQLVNEPNERGWTALMMASKCGHISIAQLLLENGADVNAKNDCGDSSLMRACRGYHLSIAELLIERGADVHAESKYHGTVLQEACTVGEESMVQLLLDNGAQVNAKDQYGRNALMEACCEGHLSLVQLLLDKGAYVNYMNQWGDSALTNAIDGSHAHVIEILLQRGANVNAKNMNGWTALMCASSVGDITCVEVLLNNGADVNAVTEDGKTALDVADNNEVRSLLQEALKKQQTDLTTALDLMKSCVGNADNRPDFQYVIALLEKHLIACQRNEREHIPEDFLCPITYDIMEDPVICSDGHSYERGAIEHWLQHHDSSPKTNMRLPNKNLIPNIALRGAIQALSSRKRARK